MFESYLWFQEPVCDDPDLPPTESPGRFDTVESAIWDLLLNINSPRGNCIIRAGIQQPAAPGETGNTPRTVMVHLGNALALHFYFGRVRARRGAAAPPMQSGRERQLHVTPVL
jgi:hypothetical protein